MNADQQNQRAWARYLPATLEEIPEGTGRVAPDVFVFPSAFLERLLQKNFWIDINYRTGEMLGVLDSHEVSIASHLRLIAKMITKLCRPNSEFGPLVAEFSIFLLEAANQKKTVEFKF